MKKFLLFTAITLSLTGCMSIYDDVLTPAQSQIQKRNYQSRYFDTNDKDMVLRAVISTMQDLGFIIDRADEKLGTVSGTSFTYSSKLTVSVRVINNSQTIVRANAQVDLQPLEDVSAYQNFFNALEQSLFLEAHEIDY